MSLSVCVHAQLQMSNCQAELLGHSHKDKSDQGLHERLDISQSKGPRERSRVNTFSAYFKGASMGTLSAQNSEDTGQHM